MIPGHSVSSGFSYVPSSHTRSSESPLCTQGLTPVAMIRPGRTRSPIRDQTIPAPADMAAPKELLEINPCVKNMFLHYLSIFGRWDFTTRVCCCCPGHLDNSNYRSISVSDWGKSPAITDEDVFWVKVGLSLVRSRDFLSFSFPLQLSLVSTIFVLC